MVKFGYFYARDSLNTFLSGLFLLFYSCYPFVLKSMEEIFIILKNREKQNQALREFVAHLITNQGSTYLGCVSTTQLQQKKP